VGISDFRGILPEWRKGAWDYLEQRDYHKYHPLLEDMAVIGRAIQWLLDSEGDRRLSVIPMNCAKQSIVFKRIRISNPSALTGRR
jgi:hypothetical protein